ncbi:MAG TPA: hypothetical protein VK623_09630 [Flavobacterium sp.]|nr:hypothetical protein [Flavobacterium sp.]
MELRTNPKALRVSQSKGLAESKGVAVRVSDGSGILLQSAAKKKI